MPVAPHVTVSTGPGALIPGGRLLPAVDKASEERMARLKAEEEKLREEFEVSQDRKRRGMMAWEKSKREAETAGRRVELVEGAMREEEVPGV